MYPGLVDEVRQIPPRERPFRIEAVLFDFDGTLGKPEAIDFSALRDTIGCPAGEGILEFLESVPEPEARRRLAKEVEAVEDEAAGRFEANEGACELLAFLRENRIPAAIITRNRLRSVERSLSNLRGVSVADFALVVTRDLPLSPKPSAEGVLYAARELGVPAENLLVVGDHDYDLEAGRSAGSLTMLLVHAPQGKTSVRPDFVVGSLPEAQRTIRRGLPLPAGKLPPDLLADGLERIRTADPAVLVGAALGEDAAAIDVRHDEILVVASDPITLAADSIGRYTVLVNANDVATSGATPRWLLATLLFPPGSTASEIFSVIGDIQETCAQDGITLCGGHTELTDAVSRPLVVGTMAGTALACNLIDKRCMREGDRLLLTKGVAIEGTGLLATEFRQRLLGAGLKGGELSAAAAFLDRIGILEEARIARDFPGVSSLHDVTEGGLAAAVRELASAGGHKLRIFKDRIPVYPETKRICAALGLDPLGLIGSGSLLLTCSQADVDPLMRSVDRAGIAITHIGEVLMEGEGVEAIAGGSEVEWPLFERDELSRLFG